MVSIRSKIWVWVFLSATLLVSCGRRASEEEREPAPVDAAHGQVHDGLELLEAGSIEAGLARLRLASRDPAARISADHVPPWHVQAVAALLNHGALAAADSLLSLTGPVEERPHQQRYLSAQLAVLRGDPDAALQIYDSVQGDPDLMANVAFERAMIHSMRGRQEETLRELEDLLVWRADHDGARALLASTLISMGRPDRALQEARLLSDTASRAILETHSLLALGRPDDALAAADRALEFEPITELALYLKGWALVDAGQAQESLEYLAPLAETRYKDSEEFLARALEKLGRTEQATKIRENLATRERRDQSQVLRAEGLGLLQSGDREAAVELLEQGREMDPENAPLLNDLAAVLTLLGRHQDAEEIFLEAAFLDPEDPSVFGNLVQLYELMGEDDKREDALRKMAAAMEAQQP